MFLLVLAYDGTDYHGWQIQPGARTVQGVVLDAARRLAADAKVIGASRTDAGVHALRQVASLTMSTGLAARVILRALNAALPHDVRAREVREAPRGFDARRAALGKRYAWHVPGALDAAAMRRALAPLRGRHDFGAFCAAPGRAKDPVCDVRALHVVRRRDRIAVLLSADRFLHHMARNIVGSAVAVGRGAREPDWLGKVLDARDRRLAGATAPPQGLTLVRVLYPNFSS